MSKGIGFYNLNIFAAFILSTITGTISLYFGTKLIGVFFEVTKLIDEGVAISKTGAFALLYLLVYGVIVYFFTIIFNLSHKRIIEYYYNK